MFHNIFIRAVTFSVSVLTFSGCKLLRASWTGYRTQLLHRQLRFHKRFCGHWCSFFLPTGFLWSLRWRERHRFSTLVACNTGDTAVGAGGERQRSSSTFWQAPPRSTGRRGKCGGRAFVGSYTPSQRWESNPRSTPPYS